MKLPSSLLFLLAAGLSSCLSQKDVIPIHHFRPQMAEITAVDRLGTRPLRFDGIRAPLEVGNTMTWRISATELSPDEQNRWARRPSELLEERLRDLLFGVGGFRDSAQAGGPQLNVELTVFEGDMSGPEALAVVELVVDLDDGNQVHHRTRLRVEEPIAESGPQGLASAMGPAMASASERCLRWLSSRLATR